MLGRLDDARVASSPRLLDLRRDQFEDALTFYDQILHQTDSNDPAVCADTVGALREGVWLKSSLGLVDVAEQYARRSLKIAERLRSWQPHDLEYTRLQIDCLSKLCALLRDGKRDQATEFGRQAVDIAQRLVQASNDNPPDLEQLAVCHNNYANCFDESKIETSITEHQTAIAIRERIDPERVPGVRIRLGESLINLGNALWHKGDLAKAEECFRRADLVLVSGDARLLSRTDAARFAGNLNVNWGGMLLGASRHNEAIARADAGLKLLEPYCRLEPLDKLARDLCLKLYGNRGHALSLAGRSRESAQAWRRVLELSPQPVPSSYRIYLASELVRSGDPEGALSEVALVKSAAAVSADEQYNLGCVCALVAADVQKNAAISIDERTRRVESHVADAMRWLKGAAAAGFFREPDRVSGARRDSDLAILSDRNEFRKLLASAAAKP